MLVVAVAVDGGEAGGEGASLPLVSGESDLTGGASSADGEALVGSSSAADAAIQLTLKKRTESAFRLIKRSARLAPCPIT